MNPISAEEIVKAQLEAELKKFFADARAAQSVSTDLTTADSPTDVAFCTPHNPAADRT